MSSTQPRKSRARALNSSIRISLRGLLQLVPRGLGSLTAKIVRDMYYRSWDTVPYPVKSFEHFAKKVVDGKLLSFEFRALQEADIVVKNGEDSIYDR